MKFGFNRTQGMFWSVYLVKLMGRMLTYPSAQLNGITNLKPEISEWPQNSCTGSHAEQQGTSGGPCLIGHDGSVDRKGEVCFLGNTRFESW